MKTILFVSPTGTFDNGAEISIFNLMKELVKRGHQVINVFPKSNHENQNLYISKCQENNITFKQLECLKWWWEDAPGALIGTKAERAASYRSNIGEICSLIRSKKIDLVITNTANMFQGAVAAAIETIPHYWLIHEFPENEFAYYLEKLNFIDNYSTEIYSVAGELNITLNSLLPNRNVKDFIPYSAVSNSELKKGEVNRIVSVGYISPRKNQLELIKAYEALEQPKIELVFIGGWDTKYKDKCLAYIKKKKLKNIVFTGNLESPWDEITDKDIAVFTSAMETFGLVYVEAILKGVPVILSNNPGHRTAYELFQFGYMYKLNDITELTKKIKFLLNNFEIQKGKSEANRTLAKEKYQLENLSLNLINDVERKLDISKNPITDLYNILSTNEAKSRMTRYETRIRRFINRVIYKLKSKNIL